ncbi:GAK6 protein, partial [Hemiprocne comata]|nr:GAK6 protein [Hemiprocne comata]
VDNEEAARVLLFQLAFQNANADCQKVITPIRNSAKSIAELLKACQNVGSEEHQASVLAAALAQQLMVGTVALKCFGCGKEGHIRKECPTRGGGQKRNSKRQPTMLCPRCRKGYHWSNQCRSKFNQGHFMQGNGKRGARPGTPRVNNRVYSGQEMPPVPV